MQPQRYFVLSGSDPSHWPQLVKPTLLIATPPSASLSSSSVTEAARGNSPSLLTIHEEEREECWRMALLEYAHAWLDCLPASSPVAHAGTSSSDAGVEGTASATVPQDALPPTPPFSSSPILVSPVAMLNALLVSVPPGPAPSSSLPHLAQQPQQQPRCAASAAVDSSTEHAEGSVEAPVSVLALEASSLNDVAAMAGHLLRHSKWLASGVSHAAGTTPRLPSTGGLLSQAYHHAFAPACATSSWAATSPPPPHTNHNAGPLASSSPDEATLHEVAGGAPSSVAAPPPPSTATWPMNASFPFHAPTSYRGCLVLLLFHREGFLRLWARDRLLSLLDSGAEAGLAALLVFALQLLCTLKHMSALPGLLSFTETRPSTSALGSAGPSAETEAIVVVAQGRVRVVVEGIFHLLTLFTAWDVRFGAAMEAWAAAPSKAKQAATGSANSAHTAQTVAMSALLSRCRATVVLLGGSLVLFGVQAVHQVVCRGVVEAWECQHRRRPLVAAAGSTTTAAAAVTGGGPARVDPRRAAQAAMAQLLHPLNELLSRSPRMPKAVAVPALTIKKTLVKVLVHCLLDNASGLASSKEEEAWRRTRLQWLWGFAAALEPPTARVAAPLAASDQPDGSHDNSNRDISSASVTGTPSTPDEALKPMLVPEKAAGWLLKPLLKNAEQQLQWSKAMATAKTKPLSSTPTHDVAAVRAASDAAAVLDRAVYGLYLLLDSLVETLPSLLSTRYLHDLLASYESSLLTLAIGGVVHTRSLHALRLHRFLFMADVRAFAAGAAAAQAPAPAPPSLSETSHDDDHYHSSSGNSSNSGNNNSSSSSSSSSRPSLFVEVPAVCLQRVWLTLPTLLTQVCKTSPTVTTSSATCLSLSQVVAHLCGTLTTLVDAEAAPCGQWLLLSSTEAMAAAPPPFQWVVQRCLRTMSDTLRDHHDTVERAWLGLPLSTAVPPPASTRAAAAATAASRLLTDEKALLQLMHALRYAGAEDGVPRRLGEHLVSIFCVGVTPSVLAALSAEAADWVWHRLVLPQPALTRSMWDITSPSVANVARAQGRHWLTLLAHCNWSQQDDETVRCGWWMGALLADVVALDAEQRRVLAEDVLLSLPTAPMLRLSANIPPAEKGGEMAEESSGAEACRVPPLGKSHEYARQEAADRTESGRLVAVAQRLFLSVLRKADQYPRASLDRLLLHLSDAIPPARALRDTAFHAAVQPLLVLLCPRRPEVQRSLSMTAAPWLQAWTAAAVQSMTACLAEQERRFRQFEMEEETLRREAEAAARTAEAQAQLRKFNQAQRTHELDEQRRSSAPATASSTSGSSSSTVGKTVPSNGALTSLSRFAQKADDETGEVDNNNNNGAAVPVTAVVPSRVLRQQLLFPDRPLSCSSSSPQPQQEEIGAKRARSPAVEHRSSSGSHAGARVKAETEGEDEVVIVGNDADNEDADVVEWEVDSDAEEDADVVDASALDRLLSAAPPPNNNNSKTASASTTTAALAKSLRKMPKTDAAAPLLQPMTKTATTEKNGGPAPIPPPPTRLQQKLQAINARNIHRVHHAEQWRRLQERLCHVAASTNLLCVQPPLINDIVGPGSQCMAPSVPVLPEVFVSAAAVMREGAASVMGINSGGDNTAITMPFGDAANAYAARFAPHIALELRCDIIRNYEDLIEGAAKTAARNSSTQNRHNTNRRGGRKGQCSCQGTTATTAPPLLPPLPSTDSTPAASHAISWTQLLPLHPSIPCTCFAVQNTGAPPANTGSKSSNNSVSSTSSGSHNAHDSLSLHFSIRACANPAVHARRALYASDAQTFAHPSPQHHTQCQVDPVVRAVADQGLSAGLSEGDVVVALLPLHALAAAWVERQLGMPLASLPEEEQSSRVQAALSLLPRSWRMLGCATQVCYVQSLLPGERTAHLRTYPPVEARSSSSSSSPLGSAVGDTGDAQKPGGSVPPLRFVHALRMAYSSPQHTFYVKKLTSLNSFQMELAALHKIDHTRFAATLYDPRYAAPLNAAYYNWITGMLTATESSAGARLPLLAQLRARLLLQRQLNDWQIRAIIAVLYATCPGWDEGDAQRCMGAVVPRAPEVLLIEGPPGTGKTQTIASLTLNLLHHLSRSRGTNARVLVCAPSNCAVDEALMRVVHLRAQLASAGRGFAAASSAAMNAAAEPRPAYNVLSGGFLRVGVKERVEAEVLRLRDPVFFDDVVERRMSSGASGSNSGGRSGGAAYASAAGGPKWASERNVVRASTIESASVIFSTLGSLHHISRQVQGLTFDVVIVDEASQGTEPAVLQALILARSKCVLVGDSKQLQPTILSTEASRCGLRRSLLVRMLACGHQSFLLRTQYRMHPDICAFPNAYFYDAKLETDRSVRLRSRTGSRTSGLLSDETGGVAAAAAAAVQDVSETTVAQRLGRCPRFVFVDVAGGTMERWRGRSLFNRLEATAVVQYMRQLRGLLRLSVQDMGLQAGIITFYNAQKDLILSMLTREERQSGLQVASVDSFQGKEKRIILLSCVRMVRRSQLLGSLSSGEERGGDGQENYGGPALEERVENRRVGRFGLGFLADGHRLNVALTRAQDLCVCFGNLDSLQAVGEAVLAASANAHDACHAPTTADSAPDDVVRQLDVDDDDPLALYRMLQHAERHDVCLHPPPPSSPPPSALPESGADSVEEVEEVPLASTETSALLHYAAQTNLVKELTKRARVAANREAGVRED